jgi:hypothetical protein
MGKSGGVQKYHNHLGAERAAFEVFKNAFTPTEEKKAEGWEKRFDEFCENLVIGSQYLGGEDWETSDMYLEDSAREQIKGFIRQEIKLDN